MTLESFTTIDLDDIDFSYSRATLSVTTSKAKKREASIDGDEVLVLKSSLDNVTHVTRGNAIFERTHPRVYSEEEILNELLAIEVEMIDELYLFYSCTSRKSEFYLVVHLRGGRTY